ncbi:DoxX family protein [Bythopirellula polymerisocia]|uniref:DoxX family protein n=1 Tax=Bythopirellula polymerisocia TaxID=2528003 RepID=UPI0011B5118F|nr:DoxX family protein [Bythopirellula polymerisocia]
MIETNPAADDCHVRTAWGCTWTGIVALVFLRLVVGWHFFTEGAKKFEYDSGRHELKMTFSAEGFFNGAKGPLAGFFQSQAPTTHDWRELLAQPQQMTPEASDKLTAWVTRYVARRKNELAKGQTTEAEFIEIVPGAAWGEQIREDWQKIAGQFKKIKSLSDEQRTQADKVLETQERNLADFLAEEALDMQDYQHQLWRLEQAEGVGGADEIPFRKERIAAKQADVSRIPLRWVAAVKKNDQYLADNLGDVLTPEQQSSPLGSRVETAVTDPQVTQLARNNLLVACVITAVGFCLLIGLFTPIAAILGALFLLMVMATQPPWVDGAKSEFFYYQLTEFAALVLLAATCAGKYAGLDSIIHRWWSKRGTTKGA